MSFSLFLLSFFFNDTATTEIYTLSLHDALPISRGPRARSSRRRRGHERRVRRRGRPRVDRRGNGRGRTHLRDRKSTRLNSSHMSISYAVFCLKKKKNKKYTKQPAPSEHEIISSP